MSTHQYSPIFGPDEPPVRVGWYVSQPYKQLAEMYRSASHVPDGDDMWWWNGTSWQVSDMCPDEPYAGQQRYWFGLTNL